MPTSVPVPLMLQLLRSYLATRKRSVLLLFFGGSGAMYGLIRLRSYWISKRRLLDTGSAADAARLAKMASHKKVGVNARFLAQLRKLLPIVVPGLWSKETGLLMALTLILIARTWLDIWFSGFNGVVVRSIVSRDRNLFIRNAILLFGFMMWPMSVVNNSLKLAINSLAVAFRARLTRYAHEQYLSGMVYYRVANLDNRIQNADQLLTQDIEKFSENLSHLYSDIAKPLVDMALFAYKLGQAIGPEAPVYMFGYFLGSGLFLRSISPSFGRYVAQEQKLEGEFRFSHSRVVTHSEEIAFYGGNEREKQVVNASFQRILDHTKKVFRLRFLNGIVDSVCVKYYATMLAYFILSRPVFSTASNMVAEQSTQIMEEYSRNSGYLVNLSQAVGRIILAGRDLTRFAGYTSRVAEFLQVLEDIKMGHYERTMIALSADSRKNDGGPVATKEQRGAGPGAQRPKVHTLNAASLGGQIIEQDGVIDFKDVPIATPNGDILIHHLTFQIRSGMNCIITGPNGCGKSSLFRILGNLWPLYGGTVIKPHPSKMFYVPQKPYLPSGSLRDQIIYPQTREQATQAGESDASLLELLKIVHLEYLAEREGGWDAIQDWADVLSGGEKQRIAMARLFYHRPQFAILDECTSAVSVDVEGIMYNYARRIGITLFTVSHRPSLFQYHEYLLKFDGQGGYEFKPLKTDEDPFEDMKASKH